jgi:ribonuclease Z
VPTRFDKDAVLAEMRRDYGGPVLIGEDLMCIDLATAVVTYGGARIGLSL